MPPPTTVTAFIQLEDLQNECSAQGVALRSDDYNAAGQLAIDDASIEAIGYAVPRYAVTSLQQSNWFWLKVKQLSVFHLCKRRLNPAPQSSVQQYERAIADLEGVRSGKLQIPDVAQSKAAIPVLSQLRVRMSPVPVTVVETGRSTGQQGDSNQRVDQVEQYFDYNL
jgi:phage gp36-like protein